MLQFITKGNVNIKDQPRVCYTAHPRDHARYFESIRSDVYRTQDCVFFYLEPDRQPNEHYYADLAEMQLFIIPVTGYFLYERCRAYEDFLFAQEHHIPVLLLKQEKGYDDLFAEKCGDLQYLSKLDDDHDGIPYSEKIDRFLAAVLVGEETVARIRAAFDAYIFLSYRKKDRTYAKKLMRLIHENDFCRDIAIWYDEYLTAGENFNDAIRAALKKSELFALAVTPNLVNEENYVMSTEYPLAKAEGKPILAVELEETDREALERCYEDVPPCTPCEDRATLSEALLDNLRQIAVRANDTDPTHNFLIGLAYLSGIDVETNHTRALELIEGAAQAGLTEAMEKLAFMYKMGEGVQRDLDKAIGWQKRLFDTLQARFKEIVNLRYASPDPQEPMPPEHKALGDAAMQAAHTLASLYFSQVDYESALDVYKSIWELSVELSSSSEDKAHYLAELMFSYRRRGDCMKAKQDFRYAITYYGAVEEYGEYEDESADYDAYIPYRDDERVLVQLLHAKSNLSTIYRDYIYRDYLSTTAKINIAIHYAEEARLVADKLDGNKSLANRRLKRIPLIDMADALSTRLQPGDKEEARRLYLQCIEECLAEESSLDRLTFLNQISTLYWRMARDSFSDRDTAREYTDKLTPILEEICELTGTLSDREYLIGHYANSARAHWGTDEAGQEKFRQISAKTIALANEVAPLTNSADIYDILMTAHWNLGVFLRGDDVLETRLAHFQEALQIAQMLSQRFPKAERFQKNVQILQWWISKLEQPIGAP